MMIKESLAAAAAPLKGEPDQREGEGESGDRKVDGEEEEEEKASLLKR